jgi:membrane protease subunit (stomatin/prohibitin family)
MKKTYEKYNIENERPGEIFNCQAVQDRLDKDSEFIVKEGFVAFVLADGVRLQTVNPGRYEIFGKKDGLAGTFDKKRVSTLRVIYISNRDAKKEVKWGIPNNEMNAQDPATEVDFRMGAYGTMTIQVANPEKFFTEWLTDKSTLTVEDFQGLILPTVKDKVRTAIVKTLNNDKIRYHQLDEKTSEIAQAVKSEIKAEFEKHFGITVVNFIISKITVPDEDKAEIKAAARELKGGNNA